MDKYIIPSKSKNHMGLVIAICLFLVLDCSILGINYYITVQVEKDAQAINISGRQRMLSQRLTKVLLLLEQDGANRAVNLTELEHVYNLFSSTLSAFERGGIVMGGDSKEYKFDAVDDAYVTKYIREARQYFDPIAIPVRKLILGNFSENRLKQALVVAKQNNLNILALMNKLTYRMEQLSQKKTASLRWIQTIAFIFAIINFMIIISMYQKRSKQAEMQVDNFLNLVDSAAASLIVMDAQRNIILANRMSQELFGYERKVFSRLHESDLFKKAGDEYFAVSRDGSSFRAEIVERRFTIHESEFIILTVNDISPYTDAQEHLAYLANHDALTGLVNRRALFDRLDLEILHARRAGSLLGIFFLDLNDFKPVNDNLGHGTGDQILRQLGVRLSLTLRETDTVARYGGDEFVVIVTGLNQEREIAKCRASLDRIFDEPFLCEGHQIQLSCSIGQAQYPSDAESAGELIELADKRMYAVKPVKTG
ncbi:diguanylate cyclase [Neptuniibacter sp.]|uniref:diguanylate cyclase domain-containing protein n=1 Tax=Neptuniibacter sp. TaxID=1962643 RepID=UPI002608F0D5|nr:diguanylate cyclase [Neptuniibacter sp.]MCP4594885.1 diguanylate cyclase [Neptuniibacter sp.]